jgi:hypothetical protein
MEGRTETRSEKARQVILKAEEKLYYVSMVSVRLDEGQKLHKAIFQAQSVQDGQNCHLEFEIPQDLYDVLVEYTKLGNPNLILVLFHENNMFKWTLVDQSWFKHCSSTGNVYRYVV